MRIETANIAMEFCCILFLLTLFFALLLKRERNRSSVMIAVIYLGVIISVLTDLIFRILAAEQAIAAALYVDYILSFSSTVFLVCCFTWYFYLRFEEKGTRALSRRIRWSVSIYSGLVILLFASSVWTELFFGLDAEGRLFHTDYYFWVPLLFLPLAVVDFAAILRYRLVLGPVETAVLLLYCILPIVAYMIDMKYATVFAQLALTLVACMLYTFIDAEQEKRMLESERELAEMQLSSMVSQINPHFIYNTLSSIESLTEQRPEEARRLISLFSDYLYDNYVELSNRPIVRFEEELRHVEHYLSIEKVRFPNLNVVYEINAGDFLIPCLSVQPLAENAVKHGICRRRKSSGTLRIVSEEREDAYLVRVEDDGVGFDIGDASDPARLHIGMKSVDKRLRLLCGGSLTVRSKVGVGTQCVITIPKE